MKNNLCISTDSLCGLFARSALPDQGDSIRVSQWSFQPLSRLPQNMLKSSCVQLSRDQYDDLELRILNQFDPVGQGQTWKSIDRDLSVRFISSTEQDGYCVSSAVAFRHGYNVNESPDVASMIFSSAVECVRDVVERGHNRYVAKRFTDLRRDLVDYQLKNS